jgi:hypothetical protein
MTWLSDYLKWKMYNSFQNEKINKTVYIVLETTFSMIY